jgi:DNA-binding NarL/FixJ family response regulator
MKVLIVDDHPIVRDGLRRLLAAETGLEVREADTGKVALALFKQYRPTVVVLDLGLPDIGGLEVIGRLKIEEPGVRILVLSMHHDPIYVTRALQAGATGYVSKNAPPDQLLDAIRRVAGGQNYIEREIAQELALANVRTPSLPLEELSRRDLEILRLLVDGRSLLQIAEAMGVSYKTIANRCTQIKARLGAARTADLVRIAIRHGLGVNDRNSTSGA